MGIVQALCGATGIIGGIAYISVEIEEIGYIKQIFNQTVENNGLYRKRKGEPGLIGSDALTESNAWLPLSRTVKAWYERKLDKLYP